MHDRLRALASALGNDRRGAPKYVVLYENLVAAIEAGTWKPGERLPAEAEIARRVSLSLGTVQRSLRMASDAGILVRRHGHGTFVAGVESRRDRVRHYRFLDDDGATLLPLYSRTLSIRADDGDSQVRGFFAPEQRFVEIRRIINVNLEFQCLDTVWLSAARFGSFLELSPAALDGVSLNWELDTRHNAPTLRTEQEVQCTGLPEAVARTLGLAGGTDGMQWLTRGYSYRDQPLFFQHGWLPPGGRRLMIGDPAPPAGG